VSSLASAQWKFSRIETLSDEANRLKERGLFVSAYELYPEIMHQIRIHEGLFSEKQLPMLMEMAAWHVLRSELEEADLLLHRAEFYVGRSTNPLIHYRTLVVQRLTLPDEQHCFEIEKDKFFNPSMACDEQRYYRAESVIAATEIMIKVVEISDNRRADLTTLAGLAEYAAFCVYEVYGASRVDVSDVTFGTQTNIIFLTHTNQLQQKYRVEKWSRLQRRTLAQLENEFEQEV